MCSSTDFDVDICGRDFGWFSGRSTRSGVLTRAIRRSSVRTEPRKRGRQGFPRPPAAWRVSRTPRKNLCGASDKNDRQMPAPGMELDVDLQLRTRLAPHKCPRSGTRRPPRPARARLEPGLSIRRVKVEVLLVRGPATEGRVRPVLIVPLAHAADLTPEGTATEREQGKQL